MSDKKTRPSRLGRGLSSLMSAPIEPPPAPTRATPEPSRQPPQTAGQAAASTSQSDQAAGASDLQHLPVTAIQPNRHQPRQRFDPSAIKSLAQSIASEGMMQPVVVRPLEGQPGYYELIAGERRWRAAQEANLDYVPALIRSIDDEKAAEWALIENIQREDLNAIEKAEAFKRLSDQFDLTHAEVAQRVGLERVTVSNLLRLLDLSDFVRDLVREKVLSMGQARALAGLGDPAQQRAVAERAVREGLSVRQVEQEVRRLQQPAHTRTPSSGTPGSAALSDLEKQIGQQLGTRVKIKQGRKKGAGTLAIEFYSLDEFDALLSRMSVNTD